MTTEHRVLLRSMTAEAVGVVSLLLEPTGGEVLPDWAPGSHIDLVLPDGSTRQYSLCGAPGDRGYRIAVLLEAESTGGSSWVHRTARVGESLVVRAPRNHFQLEDAAGYTFIAGGIGITPLLAMTEAAAAAGADWRLHYLGRSRASMAFLDRLEPAGNAVSIVTAVAAQNTDPAQGRVDVAALVAAVPDGHLVYVCGPPRLIEAARVAAEAAGVTDRLRFELFSAPVVAAADAAPSDGFTVRLTESDLELVVPADRSILEVVLEAGIDVMHDCAEGICGSCETAVASGTVDHRDYVLTEREKSENSCLMICVSRASCPVLELAL